MANKLLPKALTPLVEEDWNENWEEEPPVKKKRSSVDAAPAAESKRKAKSTKIKSENEALLDEVPGRPATAEELEPGTPVLYWDGWRGVIQDSFEAADTFWVRDESGEVVRDESGAIVDFKSSQLLIATPSLESMLTEVSAKQQTGVNGGVLILGTEEQMIKILEHFGTPSDKERTNPQQTLAIPSQMCDPEQLLQAATDGVAEEVVTFARSLREDITVGVRVFHLKQAIRQLGPDLMRLKGYFCLASVQVPWPWEAIESASSKLEKKLRREAWNQIDLCVTAWGTDENDESPEAAARSALGNTLGIEVSDVLWEKEAQLWLRRRLGVELLPLKIVDASGLDVWAVILPSDAVMTKIKGILCFSEAPGTDFTKEPALKPEGKKSTEKEEHKVQGKTVREWEAEQHFFPDQAKLPTNWLRIKSSSTGKTYYWNKETHKAQFEFPGPPPLPPGWTEQVSKSTGKVYYFHAGRRQSVFDRPAE